MNVLQAEFDMFIPFRLHHYLISNVFLIVLKAKAKFLRLQLFWIYKVTARSNKISFCWRKKQ